MLLTKVDVLFFSFEPVKVEIFIEIVSNSHIQFFLFKYSRNLVKIGEKKRFIGGEGEGFATLGDFRIFTNYIPYMFCTKTRIDVQFIPPYNRKCPHRN